MDPDPLVRGTDPRMSRIPNTGKIVKMVAGAARHQLHGHGVFRREDRAQPEGEAAHVPAQDQLWQPNVWPVQLWERVLAEHALLRHCESPDHAPRQDLPPLHQQ